MAALAAALSLFCISCDFYFDVAAKEMTVEIHRGQAASDVRRKAGRLQRRDQSGSRIQGREDVWSTRREAVCKLPS